MCKEKGGRMEEENILDEAKELNKVLMGNVYDVVQDQLTDLLTLYSLTITKGPQRFFVDKRFIDVTRTFFLFNILNVTQAIEPTEEIIKKFFDNRMNAVVNKSLAVSSVFLLGSDSSKATYEDKDYIAKLLQGFRTSYQPDVILENFYTTKNKTEAFYLVDKKQLFKPLKVISFIDLLIKALKRLISDSLNSPAEYENFIMKVSDVYELSLDTDLDLIEQKARSLMVMIKGSVSAEFLH
jgi:hypothetical protein